jgi:membrane protein
VNKENLAKKPIQLGSFLLGVLRGFKRNQGLLLSGAVAYYTLLSIVPMLILTLVVLSHFMDKEQLLQTVATYLGLVVPGYAAYLTEQVRSFLEHRHVVGVIGFIVMLFFSSLAFTVLENAMSVIFFHRVRIKRRHFLVSAVIPYVYILLLGLGILLVSFIAGTLQSLEGHRIVVFGWTLSFEGFYVAILYIIGTIGEVLMLTSLYLVMPVGRITFRYALMGGLTATILWEVTRHILVWYYSTLSLVNVIYGSLAAAVVALLSIEASAIILLLGAEVIADFERYTGKLEDPKTCGFET